MNSSSVVHAVEIAKAVLASSVKDAEMTVEFGTAMGKGVGAFVAALAKAIDDAEYM